jgi:DNA replication protein DnaC
MLVQELLRAKRDLRLERAIKALHRYEALVIDDLGYVQQTREAMEVLFTLLSERYERGSVLLSSNLVFSKWEQIFKDPMTTAVAPAGTSGPANRHAGLGRGPVRGGPANDRTLAGLLAG